MNAQNIPGNRTVLSRRTFLECASSGAAGFALCGTQALESTESHLHEPLPGSVILINNYGGPSHLDLFDMKPDARREIRGPFRPIPTRSGEFEISELLPLHADIADRFSLVRTCHHDSDALHETGTTLAQCGCLPGTPGVPHPGSVASFLYGATAEAPCNFLLSAGSRNKSRPLPSQDAGSLDGHHAPTALSENQLRDLLSGSSPMDRERYGRSSIGDCLLGSRRLIEKGARFVTVNTFDRLRGSLSWDVHGRRGFSTLDDMARRIAPRYDRAYWALITDLEDRGLLEQTLVCCLGEFGRSPLINSAGGRDHWTGCWTVYFAGGGVQGGRAIGRSDRTGAEPAERPTTVAEITATVCRGMGVTPGQLPPDGNGNNAPSFETADRPIPELF